MLYVIGWMIKQQQQQRTLGIRRPAQSSQVHDEIYQKNLTYFIKISDLFIGRAPLPNRWFSGHHSSILRMKFEYEKKLKTLFWGGGGGTELNFRFSAHHSPILSLKFEVRKKAKKNPFSQLNKQTHKNSTRIGSNIRAQFLFRYVLGFLLAKTISWLLLVNKIVIIITLKH